MKTRFNFPTRILFGQGVVEDLPAELSALGCRRPLIVTDPGLRRAGLVERVEAILRRAGLEPRVFDDVSPNPTDAQVDAGAAAFRDAGADGVVGLGGGSPLDAAKGIQVRVHHHEPMAVYDDLLGGDARITGPLPPHVAIPTTAGTGSEVSRSAVITVASVERKVVVFSPRLTPATALCDPELTHGLPPRITAETGMDALSHSVEAYVSKGYHPMADAIALQAIGMVAGNLARAVRNGKDVEARAEMMMASTMGAVAFQKGLGVVHSLAHALSAVSGVSHGLANAILLPPALRFNAKAARSRVHDVARALGVKRPTAEGAARAVERLARRLGLPTRLSAAGARESQMAALVEKAMADGCHGCNPRTVSAAEMEALFRAAW